MTLAYAAGPTVPALLSSTIGAALASAATKHPEQDALVFIDQGVRLTYAQLDRAVDEAARALIARGVGPGDRVGIWSPSRVEWMLIAYASHRIGAAVLTINPAYRRDELHYVLANADCRLVFSPVEFRGTANQEVLESLDPDLEGLRTVYFDTASWVEFLADGRDTSDDHLAERAGAVQFDDAAYIQYTSGTTGASKGAVLSHRGVLNNGYFIGHGLRLGPTDRVCAPVPFYHTFGTTLANLAAMTHGAAVVMPGEIFDPAAALAAVAAEKCTALYGVPTMFIAELELPDFDSYDLSSLRTGIMAGSPCPIAIMRLCIERMHMSEVTIVYGMTETQASTQTGADDDLEKRVTTVGQVLPHMEVRIVDPLTGRTLEHGERGEIRTRGFSVMRGYWNDPERTGETIDESGWMSTGDLGVMSQDGYITVVGRSKDLIIRGGENIYPRELEELLYGHPDITDVQVVGIPDERWGEVVAACVIARQGTEITMASLREFCDGKIARYKIPAHLVLVDEYPMTVTGKVQKFKLREQAVEQLAAPAIDMEERSRSDA